MMKNSKTQVISIVGAGGKTSLLYALAEMFLRGEGDLRLFGLEPVRTPKILVTTSTKILAPEHCGWCGDFSAVKKEWEAGRYAVAGSLAETPEKAREKAGETAGGKLKALPEGEFQHILAEADVVLIEADGAKHLPLKLPAAHEPVIRPETTAVLGVAGLSCIGKPFREICFRAELAEAAAGPPAAQEKAAPALVTAETVAAVLASERGTRKNVGDRPYLAVLNQCSTGARMAAGGEILRLLREKYGIRGVLTALPLPGAAETEVKIWTD